MSYDLDLFLPQADVAPIVTIQQAAMLHDSARTPLNRAIARHFEMDNPNFHVKVNDDVVQIMDEVEGICINLYAHGAQVSIPFWYTDDVIIKVAFDTADQYLRVILYYSRYEVYDSQLGRIVQLERDLPHMIATYKQALRGMQSFI